MSKDSDFLTLMVYRSLLFLKKRKKNYNKKSIFDHTAGNTYEALHVQGDDTISASVNYIWFLQKNNQVSRSHGARTVLTVLNRCLFNSVIVDSLLSCWLIMLKLFKSSFFFFFWHIPKNLGALKCYIIESLHHHFHSLRKKKKHLGISFTHLVQSSYAGLQSGCGGVLWGWTLPSCTCGKNHK